jgi:single-strand DNA-binding protein
MLNHIAIIGRLTRDPELRYTPTGVATASFTLAVDRNFKNAKGERETDFIPCVVYRQQAENCANYLSKGRQVAVDGRLQIRNYEDKDGQKRSWTEVVADTVHFLGSKNDGDFQDGAPRRGGQAGGQGGSFDDVGVEISIEDDMPF